MLIINSKSLESQTNLQETMCLDSFGLVTCDLGPLLQSQASVAKPKSAHYSLIIGPRGLGYINNLQEITCWESSALRLDLGSLLQGQTRIAKLKSALIGSRGLGCVTKLWQIMSQIFSWTNHSRSNKGSQT